MMITIQRNDKTFFLYRNDDYEWTVTQLVEGRSETIVKGLSQYEMLKEMEEML